MVTLNSSLARHALIHLALPYTHQSVPFIAACSSSLVLAATDKTSVTLAHLSSATIFGSVTLYGVAVVTV